jgi:hypothetical protein
VLAPQNDPFRVDTPARHRDGEWLALTARSLGFPIPGDRKIHLRGLHYMVIDRRKPDRSRSPYTNTDRDWLWLSSDAGKAAQWLGYIPFDQIVDQLNAPPVIREFTPPESGACLSTELDIEIPHDITPTLYTHDFRGVQPYKIVMFGEKSSLADVLSPLAETYQADLYLPTGRSPTRSSITWPASPTGTAARWQSCAFPTATRQDGRCRSASPGSCWRSRYCCPRCPSSPSTASP